MYLIDLFDLFEEDDEEDLDDPVTKVYHPDFDDIYLWIQTIEYLFKYEHIDSNIKKDFDNKPELYNDVADTIYDSINALPSIDNLSKEQQDNVVLLTNEVLVLSKNNINPSKLINSLKKLKSLLKDYLDELVPPEEQVSIDSEEPESDDTELEGETDTEEVDPEEVEV